MNGDLFWKKKEKYKIGFEMMDQVGTTQKSGHIGSSEPDWSLIRTEIDHSDLVMT